MELEAAVKQAVKRTGRGSVVDGRAIKQLTRTDPGTDVSQKELDRALREMGDYARRRVVINNSGGLPGPPYEPPRLRKRIEGLFDRMSKRSEGT